MSKKGNVREVVEPFLMVFCIFGLGKMLLCVELLKFFNLVIVILSCLILFGFGYYEIYFFLLVITLILKSDSTLSKCVSNLYNPKWGGIHPLDDGME